ncbi:MAG: ATP-binding protein [Phycisphaerae bacterium]|nr:ATP-binding protein [Phycisphaerae bacterium]
MSLRYRLLLVYLIVVLLTAATVAVTLLELRHSSRIIADLQHWQEAVLRLERLRTAFEREALSPFGVSPVPPPEGLDFEKLLAETRNLLDFDLARWHLQVVARDYREWQELARRSATRPANPARAVLQTAPSSPAEEDPLSVQTGVVRRTLQRTVWFLEGKQTEVMNEANEQTSRTMAMLNIVLALLALHVLMVGWLFGRWVLAPMARLNRQVEALAQDSPPDEPLLTAPPEMANLAEALDDARISLGEMRNRLVESERLTAVGHFAAQLAHNLRNPLASIRAVAQVTARHDAGDGQIRDRMAEIIVSVDRLNRWIGSLMEVVRQEATALQMADVLPVIHRVQEALSVELSAKDLTCHLEASPGEFVCLHNPDTLEHALVAMAVNAIEASPVGGRITVRVERTPRGMCRISVMDGGPGLPRDDPEIIFDSSFSTKEQGLGLGLPLVRLAVDRQGGATGAMNNPDGGAIVFVELPMSDTGGRHQARTALKGTQVRYAQDLDCRG